MYNGHTNTTRHGAHNQQEKMAKYTYEKVPMGFEEVKYLFSKNSGMDLMFDEALTLLQTDCNFQYFVTSVLNESGMLSYSMEWPPVSLSSNSSTRFQFVLKKKSGKVGSDPQQFKEHIHSHKDVVVFENYSKFLFR